MLCEHGGWYGIFGIYFVLFYTSDILFKQTAVFGTLLVLFGVSFLRFLFVDWMQAEVRKVLMLFLPPFFLGRVGQGTGNKQVMETISFWRSWGFLSFSCVTVWDIVPACPKPLGWV